MVCWETFVARLRRLQAVPPESNERELQKELGADTHEEAERLILQMSDTEIIELAAKLRKRKSRTEEEMAAYA
jgi:acetylornithine/succinyldiaminopimelate/putrescine aminotransferase